MPRNNRPFCLMLILAVVGMGLGLSAPTHAEQGKQEVDKAEKDQPQVPAALNFAVKRLSGDDTHLSQYYGDVVLFINTASKCGLTPQYEQLQQLHETYHEAGLSILGFPANNFGKQEPGTDKQISVFCKENYGVEFDMFSKISVKGKDQAPLYRFLTSEDTNPKFAGPVRWNFDKFLASRDGKVIARFSPRTRPDAKEVVEAIKKALKKPVPEDVEAVRALHRPKEDGGEKADEAE